MRMNEAPLGYGRYRAILDSKNHLTDAEILEVNPGFEMYFGEKEEDIVGKSKFHFFAAFYEGREQEWREKYRRVAVEGDHFVETVFYEPGQVYFEINVSSPAQGEFITLFRDVSETIATNSFYQDILASISDAVFITDQEGIFKFIGPNVSFIFGVEEQEIMDHGKIEFLLGTSCQQYIEGQSVIDQILVKNLERSVVDKQGKVHHLLIDIKKIAMMGGSFMFTCRDVTESKLASKEAENERDKLRAVLDTIPDLIWIKDPEGFYTTCNREFELFYGAKEQDIVGKTDRDFVSEEMADFFRKHDLRAMNAGQPLRNEEELTYRSLDKTVVTETTKTPFYSKNGEIIGVLGIARDITSRKRSEMRLEEFLNGVPDAIYSINENGIIEDVNESVSRMTGYKKEALVGAPMWKINKNFDGIELFRQKFLTLERNQSYIIESVHTCKDQTTIPVEVSVRVFDFGDKPHFFAIARDISERKKQESAFREMVHQAPYGIALVSNEGTPYMVNESLVKMLGYSSDELCQTAFKDFTHPDDFDTDFTNYQKLIKEEISQYSIEKRYLHKDGSIIPAALKVTLIEDPFAETGKRALAMVEDLSDKKRNERELEKYHRFFTIAHDNFCIAEANGTLVELNPQFPETLGYSMQKLIGSNFLDLVHPDDVEMTLAEMEHLNSGQKTINFQNRYRTQSGEYVTFEWISTPHDGYYYAVARDITSSLKDQQRILEAESIYKIMQEVAPYPIQMITSAGEISYLNKQALDLWGYDTLDELIGKPITDIDESLNMDQIGEIINQMQPGEVGQFETTQRHKDGTIIPVEMRVLFIPYGDNALFFGMARDLRPQLAQEKVLREANELLLQSQKMAKLGSWKLDVTNDHLHWSDEIFRIFGENPQAFEGTVEAFYDFIHPEERQKVQDHFNACVAEQKHYHIIHRIVTRAGEIKYVEENASFEYDEQKELLMANGTVQDITEKQVYQRELVLRDENLHRFFENVHVGIARNAMNGDFVEINPEFERFTGYNMDELNEMSYWDLTPERYADQEEQQLKSLEDHGRYGPYQKEYRKKSGELIPVLLNGVKTSDTEGNEFIWSVVQDISDGEQYKEQLRQDVEKYKILLDTGKLIAFEVDLQTSKIKTIRDRSKIDSSFFPIDEIKNMKDFFDHIKEEHQGSCMKKMDRMKNGDLVPFTCDFQIRKGDLYFWHEGILSVLETDQKGKVKKVFVTLRNIEDEKNREVLRIQSQEKERLRVARDIHDSIGQLLVGTRMMLHTKLAKDEGLKDIDEMLHEMIKESRMIINNFGISVEMSDLKASFESLTEKMGKVYTGSIETQWTGKSGLNDLKLATYFFRVFQEALSNAIKYSKSRIIRINVRNNDHFHMDVIDEGEGFDYQTVTKGFGLTNMAERASEIDYKLIVRSTPEQGTTVSLRPLLF